MDRDDGRHGERGRQHVLEVRERGPQPAQEPRQRDRHAQLLRARRQLDRLDAGRDEVGPARHRREAQVGRDAGSSRSRFST